MTRREYDDTGWPVVSTVSSAVQYIVAACALLTVAYLGVIAFVVVFGQ